MATTKDQAIVTINQNLLSTPEIVSQIQEYVTSKFDVDTTIIPSPIATKPVSISSDTLDETTKNNIEAETTIFVMQLFGASQA